MTVVRAPLPPRPAASLILLRDGPAGLEVLIGRRALHARTFPGVLSFPGGKIDLCDRSHAGPNGALLDAAGYAALRETFEETGLLVAADGAGPPAGVDVASARAAVERGELSFADLLDRWKCACGLQRLQPFSNWITPKDAPYRFDTWFFVAEASPYEAGAELICAEFAELRWARPTELLNGEGSRLIRPTRGNLEVLMRSGTARAAVVAAASGQPFQGRPESFSPG